METANLDTLQWNADAKRNREMGEYLGRNAGQVCYCFKMKENIAVLNTNGTASVGGKKQIMKKRNNCWDQSLTRPEGTEYSV